MKRFLRKSIAYSLTILMVLSIGGLVGCAKKGTEKEAFPSPASILSKVDTGDRLVHFVANENGYFYRMNADNMSLVYVKGVNIGLSEADSDLADIRTTEETYTDWLQKISDMNANTVRVFSLMPSSFYTAFEKFNETSSRKLYLVQGIWFPEKLLDLADALESDEILISAFAKSVEETVAAIHGSLEGYENDISDYVLGYVLGLEYPAGFVLETNASHPDEAHFVGRYLETTKDSSPFEAFLCRIGDKLIETETQNFRTQTPVAFLNWQTLDTLTHTNEPFADEEDIAVVNTEHIVSRDSYKAGLFAAVDVYPYYPEYMNTQPEYVSYKDKNGNADNYRAYLNDLKKEYSVPLLIAEYGLSTSRGLGHGGINGYAQGGMTEIEQGRLNAQMTKDIAYAGCAGGLLFNWQDEWFKRTWNAVMYYPDDPTERTLNLSSAEQGYGIMTYRTSDIMVDGAISDWAGVAPTTDHISVQYDSASLYLLVTLPKNFDFEKDTFYIPISVLGLGSTKASEKNLTFTKEDGKTAANVDFLLEIHGKENTRVLTDAYNDLYHYQHGVLRKVLGNDQKTHFAKNSGIYNTIQRFVGNEMYLPVTEETIPCKSYEDGLLRYGTQDPMSEKFDSLADFIYIDGHLEIRIPWYLIGIMNPKTSTAIGELKGQEITFTNFEEIQIGGGTEGAIRLSSIGFKPVQTSYVGTRLKKSYEIMQKCFSEITIR